MENIGKNMKGIYRDILLEPGKGTVFDSGWNNNTIVDQCRMLLSGFVGRDTTTGIDHLAVGQGDAAWDNSGIPPTDPETTTSLFNPHTPAINHNQLDFNYLDDSDNPTAGPTSRLQISATLVSAYPPLNGMTAYPLREFGLFGQFNGSDYMINCIRHPVIHKGATATLIRTVRLFF